MEAVKDNTVVVIPSYNEARTIGSIVLNIVKMGLSVLVIDDGSIDNTERIALDNGAMVIRHRQNIGKGFSVREGIKYVLSKTNFEWMIIMDGDGQHRAEDIPGLMTETHHGEVDIVTGNRMLETKTMPSLRYVTNKFMSWVISGICRQSIPDTQCGYRLIRVCALKKLKLMSEKYDIESEMLLQAAESNMRIKSVPIQTIYGEEVSDIKPLRDTLKFCDLIFRHYFNRKNNLKMNLGDKK
ncbi:MAG: glycosyltransferase family 2 protein [Candidatus Omnitrophota bacterium]|nr:glycosyltransferase family 2 protein [Candidatus Omnitrophota bacterium]MBU1894602.1 glycosyltransferase family 2 protein [Candidatus Omnitrophota bacterium]